MHNSRRLFFKHGGMGLLAWSLSSSVISSDLFARKGEMTASKKEELFQIAIAGWTFVKFAIDPSLAMTKRLDIKYFCLKDFHLPLDCTSEQIAEIHQKLSDQGIKCHAVGPLYMDSPTAVDKVFAYAKRVGVELVIGVPNPELLPYVDEKVKEYGFRFAIHNHGIGDKHFATVKSIYDQVKDLDARIGICHDIGYSAQMGFDPAKVTLEYGHRIYEMHIKDITEASAQARDCEIGRGIIDFEALVKALRTTRYQGKCSIEMEKDNTDPLPAIAESVGYLRGVIKSI